MDKLAHLMQHVPPPLQLGLTVVGALVVGSKILSYVRLLLSCFVLSGTNLYKYGKPGSWVVITGASDGMGKEFASQLAKKGFNLVLVSRTASKLETLATEIEQKYSDKGVQTKTWAMDFSQNNDSDYRGLAQLVQGLDVAILVNNVGQSHSIPVPFLETPQKELEDIISINCVATLRVTQLVGPLLKQRKKGLILTIGSFAGWTPIPLLATYSGSKAFLQRWNNALAAELSDYHVDCYLVLGHLITGAMSKVRRPSLLVPTGPNFVRAALGKVGLGGYQEAPYTYTPWWSHSFMLWVVENTVGNLSRITLGQTKTMHVDIRRRALRKAERQAKKE